MRLNPVDTNPIQRRRQCEDLAERLLEQFVSLRMRNAEVLLEFADDCSPLDMTEALRSVLRQYTCTLNSPYEGIAVDWDRYHDKAVIYRMDSIEP